MELAKPTGTKEKDNASQKKASSGDFSHEHEYEVEDTLSQQYGMPLYLQRSVMGGSTPPIQRQTAEDDEEEEVLQTKKNSTSTQCASIQANIQAKLTIGEPDDEYEREADAVADKVMRLPMQDDVKQKNITPFRSFGSHNRNRIPKFQQKSDKTNNSLSTVSPSVSNTINSPGSGQPLNEPIKSRTESVLNTDLSRVRVHNDDAAQKAARDINARAFTHQNNIFLGRGESTSDIGLMAHEITHTAQQSTQDIPDIQRFEARYHESAERVGLGGSGGLTQDEITQIYIGNWMRDVNQAFVPTMQASIPHHVRFALLKYMGVKKFGQSFSAEQMGFYIPAEHMDSPAGLLEPSGDSGDVLTAQPSVVEGRAIDPIPDSGLGANATPQESVDPSASVSADIDANIFSVDQTGVMAFIRRTNQHIERRLTLASELGRTPEGMMHFGAALHPIEDLFAHSNWIEIAANRVLADNPTLLADYLDEGAEIFTLAGTIPAGPYENAMISESRPILTTGSFATLDTAISISHEMISFLREGLHAESNPAVGEAQKELILAFVGQYGGESSAEYVAIIQSVPFPSIPAAVLNWAYSFVNPQLAAYAEQVETQMAEQRVSDTNLMRVREANQGTMRGEFSSISQQMMELEAQFGEIPVAEQQRLKMAEAAEREAVFAATPEQVLAGPSHSQIAKDHGNSIFFGIAFRLATVAISMMREKMTAVWSAQGDTESYTRERPAPAHPNEAGMPWEDGYVLPWERGRGATPRTSRNFSTDLDNRVQESLEVGEYVLEHGHAEGQSYDIDGMRSESAATVRGVGDKLTIVGTALLTPRWSRSIARDMLKLADEIKDCANEIGDAETFEERDTANKKLSALQSQLVEQVELYMEGSSGFDPQSLVLGTIMTVLNREVASTAVAYTEDQRRILNTNETPFDIEVSHIDLGEPDLTGFSESAGIRGAVHDLIMESRKVVGHPYENLWWYSDVLNYIEENSAQFAEEVRARNAGWAGFRHNESSH